MIFKSIFPILMLLQIFQINYYQCLHKCHFPFSLLTSSPLWSNSSSADSKLTSIFPIVMTLLLIRFLSRKPADSTYFSQSQCQLQQKIKAPRNLNRENRAAQNYNCTHTQTSKASINLIFVKATCPKDCFLNKF